MSEEILLCPSVMCADFNNLRQEIRSLDIAGADIFHCDIMDGRFVPNLTMGIRDIETVRANTEKRIDVHLMISNPERLVPMFIERGVDIIYLHVEGNYMLEKTIFGIRQNGVSAGIALNPSTPLSLVKELLPLVDYVLLMTVTPGFAGQKYLEFVNGKIREVLKIKKKYGFKVIIDGAMSEERITNLYRIGADGFVLGTSSLFGKSRDYASIMHDLRENNQRLVTINTTY